jgi:hypothetical protein
MLYCNPEKEKEIFLMFIKIIIDILQSKLSNILFIFCIFSQ